MYSTWDHSSQILHATIGDDGSSLVKRFLQMQYSLSLSDVGVFNKNLPFSMSFILSHCLCISPCISNRSSTSITWFLIIFFLNEVKAISPLMDKSLVSIFSFFLLFFNNVLSSCVLENDIGIEGFLTNVFFISLFLGRSKFKPSSSF